MTNYFLGILTGLAVSGLIIGIYYARDIKAHVAQYSFTPVKPRVTFGSEKPADENYPINNPSSGIVIPKTPQRIAWEAENQLDKEVVSHTNG